MCGEGLVSAAACWEEQRPASVAGGEERGSVGRAVSWQRWPAGGGRCLRFVFWPPQPCFVQGFHALGGRFVSGGKGMCHGIKPSVVLHAKTGVLHSALQHG